MFSVTAKVTSCNNDDGLVQLSATVSNHEGTYSELDAEGNGVFPADQLTKSFTTDKGVNYLVLTKVLGGTDCTRTEVDGVNVCTKVAEQITLQCKYSLADQDLTDGFQVTGQDTTATAENTGTLEYNLTVEDGDIGDQIKFTVSPVNPNLVYATVKSCDVIKGDNELTIVGHGSQSCTNPIVNTLALTDFFSSQGDIEGSWKAFKWSTATDDNIESQSLSCKIGLSQGISAVAVEDCTKSNAPQPDYLALYYDRFSTFDWTGPAGVFKDPNDPSQYTLMTNLNGPALTWGGLHLGTKEVSKTIDGDTLVVEYNEGDPCEHEDAEKHYAQLRVTCDTEAAFSVVNVEQTGCRSVWTATADCSKCYFWQKPSISGTPCNL